MSLRIYVFCFFTLALILFGLVILPKPALATHAEFCGSFWLMNDGAIDPACTDCSFDPRSTYNQCGWKSCHIWYEGQGDREIFVAPTDVSCSDGSATTMFDCQDQGESKACCTIDTTQCGLYSEPKYINPPALCIFPAMYCSAGNCQDTGTTSTQTGHECVLPPPPPPTACSCSLSASVSGTTVTGTASFPADKCPDMTGVEWAMNGSYVFTNCSGSSSPCTATFTNVTPGSSQSLKATVRSSAPTLSCETTFTVGETSSPPGAICSNCGLCGQSCCNSSDQCNPGGSPGGEGSLCQDGTTCWENGSCLNERGTCTASSPAVPPVSYDMPNCGTTYMVVDPGTNSYGYTQGSIIPGYHQDVVGSVVRCQVEISKCKATNTPVTPAVTSPVTLKWDEGSTGSTCSGGDEDRFLVFMARDDGDKSHCNPAPPDDKKPVWSIFNPTGIAVGDQCPTNNDDSCKGPPDGNFDDPRGFCTGTGRSCQGSPEIACEDDNDCGYCADFDENGECTDFREGNCNPNPSYCTNADGSTEVRDYGWEGSAYCRIANETSATLGSNPQIPFNNGVSGHTYYWVVVQTNNGVSQNYDTGDVAGFTIGTQGVTANPPPFVYKRGVFPPNDDPANCGQVPPGEATIISPSLFKSEIKINAGEQKPIYFTNSQAYIDADTADNNTADNSITNPGEVCITANMSGTVTNVWNSIRLTPNPDNGKINDPPNIGRDEQSPYNYKSELRGLALGDTYLTADLSHTSAANYTCGRCVVPVKVQNPTPPSAFNFNAPSTFCSGSSPSVYLSWFAPPEAASYDVLRSVDGGVSWPAIASTTNTFFTDNTISANTTYKYSILAKNSDGNTYSTPPSYQISTLSCGNLPWIQTVGGDVHSNTGINTPGGP